MMTDIVLQVDEMAIRKSTPWCPSKNQFVGFITPSSSWTGSTEAYEENAELASSALVVLVAGISGGWKCPIGYIFTDKVDSDTMVSMVTTGLKLLREGGFRVHAIISDGFAANVSMFEKLGMKEKPFCKYKRNVDMVPIRYEDINPVLTPTSDTDPPLHTIFDMCHELKLWRNLLGQCSGIQDESGNSIDWKYVKRLQEHQEAEGIKAGNKLGRKHVDFDRHKMNVKLAAQVLSSSVADSLDLCRANTSLRVVLETLLKLLKVETGKQQ